MNPTEKRRNGVAEVIPGKLYQRANFLTWPYGQKKAMLDDLGVNVVVNLWRPVDSDMADNRPGTKHNDRIYLNWHMATNVAPSGGHAMVRFLGDLMRQGHVLLVHCEAGRNRSAWLCARLVKDALRVTPEHAIQIVTRAAPRIKISTELQADIFSAPYYPLAEGVKP